MTNEDLIMLISIIKKISSVVHEFLISNKPHQQEEILVTGMHIEVVVEEFLSALWGWWLYSSLLGKRHCYKGLIGDNQELVIYDG